MSGKGDNVFTQCPTSHLRSNLTANIHQVEFDSSAIGFAKLISLEIISISSCGFYVVVVDSVLQFAWQAKKSRVGRHVGLRTAGC